MSNQTKNSETLSWVCLGVGVVSWLFNPFALLSILGIFLYVYTRSTYGVKNIKLMQFRAYGSKNRTSDPKDVHWLERAQQAHVERIVTISYLALVKIDRAIDKSLDAHKAGWVPLNDVKRLAFDHNLILAEAMHRIRDAAEVNPVMLFDLLPRKFTASQLRTMFELIYGHAIDVRNFHKKIAMMDYVVPLEERQQGVAHRAARYYKFDRKIYNKNRR